MAEIDKGPLLGQRHLQALLLFLATVINFNSKLNVSVAVVAMTNAKTTNPDFPEYNWTEMQKSLIISSFFWGYFVTQFPGGFMCRRFGAKSIMFTSTLGSAVLALIIPISVEYGGWQGYCGIRIIQGLFQGLLFPCVFAHLAAWCPVSERNRLGGLVIMGIEWGTMFSMYVSGMIAASTIGWPGISYVSSALGGVWCIFWFIFAANSPKESNRISLAEKNYIENSKNAFKELNMRLTKKTVPIPWRAIFTSGPFLALLVAICCQAWGFFTLQAEIPSYMNGVLGMDIKENALFSALPYLAMLCMSYVYLILSDLLLHNNILSLNALRKTFSSLSLWLPAVGLICLGFVDEKQKTVAIVLMTASVGINAGNTIGITLNTIDLSPNHASILVGISNTLGPIIPIITPIYVGLIVKDQTNRFEWQIVFATSALFFAIGNLIYIIFGSTKLQPWDDVQNDERNKQVETQRRRRAGPSSYF